jgi:hypothetical protein
MCVQCGAWSSEDGCRLVEPVEDHLRRGVRDIVKREGHVGEPRERKR